MHNAFSSLKKMTNNCRTSPKKRYGLSLGDIDLHSGKMPRKARITFQCHLLKKNLHKIKLIKIEKKNKCALSQCSLWKLLVSDKTTLL